MTVFLLDLPNETLLQIISKVPNADLDSFTSTCKSLRMLAASALRSHGERKRTFAKIVYGNPEHHNKKSTWVHPTLMLRDVLQEDLFSYPKMLSIYKHSEEGAGWDDGRMYHGSNDECEEDDYSEVYHALQTFPDDVGPLVKACPHINGNGDLVRGVLEHGDIGATLGLLINLLPNLSTMDVTDYNTGSQGIENFKQILDSMLILNAKHDVEKPPKPTHPTCKLRNLKITRSNLDDPDWGLSMYAPLFYFPSMRSINAEHLTVYGERWSYPSYHSDLEKLCLRSADLKLECLVTYIKDIKNLRELRLVLAKEIPEESSWGVISVEWAVWTVFCTAGHSLRHLEIGGNLTIPARLRAGLHYVGKLSRFKELTTITVGLTMFTNPSERLDRWICDSMLNPGVPQKLIDILPPSIVYVAFTRECIFDDEVEKSIIIDMLQELPEKKHEFVPNLVTVEFKFLVESFRYEIPKLLRDCGEVGVRIIHSGRELN